MSSEFDIIRKYFLPLSSQSLCDDVAVLADASLVCSKDVLVSNTHFFLHDDAFKLAQKALAVNLSDIASSGARPLYYMLGLVVPKDVDMLWFERFTKGLLYTQEKYNITLIGGDTTVSFSNNIIISITIFGIAETGKLLLRSNAEIGDDILVSGTIGDSFLGLQIIKGQLPDNDSLRERYYLPQPRVELGMLISQYANACIDISDGLLQDLQHICKASDCGARLFLDRIPLSEDAQCIVKDDHKLRTKLFNAGDDYELLFTCPARNTEYIKNYSKDVSITKIGYITSEMLIKDESSNIIGQTPGYDHFNLVE